jgi:hypothetical protein
VDKAGLTWNLAMNVGASRLCSCLWDHIITVPQESDDILCLCLWRAVSSLLEPESWCPHSSMYIFSSNLKFISLPSGRFKGKCDAFICVVSS